MNQQFFFLCSSSNSGDGSSPFLLDTIGVELYTSHPLLVGHMQIDKC